MDLQQRTALTDALRAVIGDDNAWLLVDALPSKPMSDYATAEGVGLVQQRLDDLRNDVERLTDDVNTRFEQVDKRFEQVDKRFDRLEERFDRMDIRFDTVRSDIQNMSNEFHIALSTQTRLFVIGSITMSLSVAGLLFAALQIS